MSVLQSGIQMYNRRFDRPLAPGWNIYFLSMFLVLHMTLWRGSSNIYSFCHLALEVNSRWAKGENAPSNFSMKCHTVS